MRRDNTSAIVSLWKSNGTAAGTTLVREFEQGSLDQLTDVNGILLFFVSASGDLNNLKHSLWRSDGTTAGTVMLQAFNNLRPIATTVADNGILFFSEGLGPLNSELWTSDGTISNTLPIFSSGIGPVSYLTSVNDTLFFFQLCETGDCGLWRLLDNNPVLLKPFIPAQGSSAI